VSVCHISYWYELVGMDVLSEVCKMLGSLDGTVFFLICLCMSSDTSEDINDFLKEICLAFIWNVDLPLIFMHVEYNVKNIYILGLLAHIGMNFLLNCVD
jgi:hypothetical protein